MSQDNEPNIGSEASFDFDFLNPEGSPDAFAQDAPGMAESVFPDISEGISLDKPEEVPFSQDANEGGEAAGIEETPAVVPPVEQGKGKKTKKAKKEKPKRAKKARDPNQEPADLGAVLSLSFAIALGVALLAWNVYVLLFEPYKSVGVGFSSTIYYLVGVDIFGGIAIVVPWLFYKFKTERTLFNVLLGTSAIALLIGLIFLLDVLYRYDFLTKVQ